jgi:hypothetical protein
MTTSVEQTACLYTVASPDATEHPAPHCACHQALSITSSSTIPTLQPPEPGSSVRLPVAIPAG